MKHSEWFKKNKKTKDFRLKRSSKKLNRVTDDETLFPFGPHLEAPLE